MPEFYNRGISYAFYIYYTIRLLPVICNILIRKEYLSLFYGYIDHSLMMTQFQGRALHTAAEVVTPTTFDSQSRGGATKHKRL